MNVTDGQSTKDNNNVIDQHSTVDWVRNRKHSALERRTNYVSTVKKINVHFKMEANWKKNISNYLYNRDSGQGHDNKSSWTACTLQRKTPTGIYTELPPPAYVWEETFKGKSRIRKWLFKNSDLKRIPITQKTLMVMIVLLPSLEVMTYLPWNVLTYYFQVISFCFDAALNSLLLCILGLWRRKSFLLHCNSCWEAKVGWTACWPVFSLISSHWKSPTTSEDQNKPK